MTEPALRIGGDIMAAKAVVESQATMADAPRFLQKRARVDANGERVIDISDKRARAAVLDLVQPELDRRMNMSRKLQACIPKVAAITPRGERREVAAHLESGLGAKGFRPAVYYGKVAGRRIERWSDWLLYRETPSGDYEPMGVCCLGTPIAPCASPKCARCA